jgi:hypothetical protein
MRLICQHCQKTIAYLCPFCGDHLADPRVDDFKGTHKACESGMTAILFSIRTMRVITSICDDCRQSRDQVIALLADFTANAEAELTPTPKKVSP